MGLFSFFSPKSSTSVSNTSNYWTDSFNTTTNRTEITSDVGNVNLNLGGADTLDKLLPLAIVILIAVVATFAFRRSR